MKILIIKSSSMGDVVHALPVAFDIAQHFPDAVIDWVAEESFRDIPRLSPFVGDIIQTAFRRWQKHPTAAETWREAGAVKRRLRDARYDIVIDLQGLARTGLVMHWAHAPKAAGFSFGCVREWPAALFYSSGMRFPLEETMGAVHRYRALAAAALGYKAEGRPRFGLKTFRPNPMPLPGAYAALAVNTSQARKLWPEGNWVEVARQLSERGLSSVLFWGNDEEKQRVKRIAAQAPGCIVAPRLPLADIASVLMDALIVVGVDTGISHLGAALARPTIGIFVQTSLEKVPIFGDAEYVNLGGPGQMPTVDDVMQQCGGFLK